jgi:hypothetical protein
VGGIEPDGSITKMPMLFRATIDLALDQVNADPNLLGNFELDYRLTSFGHFKLD